MEDPLAVKKLPIEFGIPGYLIQMAVDKEVGEDQKVIAKITLIKLYYLM